MAKEQLNRTIDELVNNDRGYAHQAQKAIAHMSAIQDTQEALLVQLQKSNRVLLNRLRNLRRDLEDELTDVKRNQHVNREAIARTIRSYVSNNNEAVGISVD